MFDSHAGTASGPVAQTSVLDCECACHDASSRMCGFLPCCRASGQARVVYPDRPPPSPDSPFVWRWLPDERIYPYVRAGDRRPEPQTREPVRDERGHILI